MPSPYCYEYPRPMVTVDLAVFTWTGEGLRLLLIRRKHDPFEGRWALPGGFLNMDEEIEVGARRELREETGLEASGPVELFAVFGAPGRDPRGRTITLAHGTVVRGPSPRVHGADDAAEAEWRDPLEDREYAFDHAEIVRRALDWLRRGVGEGPLGPAILPEEFGRGDVARLLKAVGASSIAPAGWLSRQVRSGRVSPPARPRGRFRVVEEPRVAS